jgi:hypothetical protein
VSFLSFVSVVLFTARAGAQTYDSVGIRAQGMGGAFVAVSDDADAAWWNPAGLAGGAYFNALIEYGKVQEPAQATDPTGAALPAWRDSARGFTVAFPALALSYYRLQVSEIRPLGPATDAGTVDRQDRGGAPVSLSTLVLQQFGATVGESIGSHFVIGSTVRIVRGRFAVATSAAADASLDRAAGLEGAAATRGDVDVGAMATFGGLRLGAAVKHLTQPSFTSGDDRVDLNRQARVGISATTPGAGALGPLTIAVDADVTRTPTAAGDVRHVGAGAEAWLLARRIGLRGGVTANTADAARPSGSAGASVAVRSGLYVDGQLTRGSDRTVKGWGFALRVTF